MRLIVQDHDLIHTAHDFPKIHEALRCLSDRLGTEKIFLTRAVGGHMARVNAVDVGKKDVAIARDSSDLVLKMQFWLEIALPIAALIAVLGKHRIAEKNIEPVEVMPQTLQHDDVRRDDKEVPGKRRILLVKLVKITPHDEQGEHLGLAATGGHLQHQPRPVLGEHPGREAAGRVKTNKVNLVAHPRDLVQIDYALHRLALGKIEAERNQNPVLLREMRLDKPPAQERLARRARPGIAALT